MKIQNHDVWFGYIKLLELSKIDLPVETNIGISRIINALKEPYKEIEIKRIELLKKYGRKNRKRKQLVVDPLSERSIKFAAEFGEILLQSKDVQIERIKLPRKIVSYCNNCQSPIEVSFLISPDTLLPLLGKFIE